MSAALETVAPLGRYPAWCRAGDVIHVSGMSARRADGTIDGVHPLPHGGVALDVAHQTRVVIGKIDAALAQAGASLSDCVSVTVYLTDMADFDAYNAVYAEHFDGRAARATVGVHALPHPHMAVELSVTAYKPLAPAAHGAPPALPDVSPPATLPHAAPAAAGTGAVHGPRPALDDAALDTLFRQARSHNGWLPRAVDDGLLAQLYELARYCPTSVNGCPARIVFVRTEAGKARLLPALSPGNVDKVRGAPVVAVIGYDTRFHEHLPHLFPHNPGAAAPFAANPALAEATAFRNGSLQGAWLMLAARALGLDCGPLSGFDAAAVNRAFFPDGRVKVNFLCNLGHGDAAQLFPRNPRPAFGQACTLL